jgi:hypothetical protein
MSKEALNLYFHEKILEARHHQKLDSSEDCIFYLSNLLTKSALDFSNDDVYVSDLYQDSIDARSRQESFRSYKRLGDHTLIVSGYFPESLYSKSVSIDYYIEMGTTAYYQISDNSKIYRELSESYRNIVSILNEVSERSKKYSHDDIFKLYSLWLRTHNEDIRNKLMRLGMIVEEVKE